jgi:hypothetical protein
VKILIGAVLLATAVIGIPIALVTVPAVAVRDGEATNPAADPEAARSHCGIRMECLQ